MNPVQITSDYRLVADNWQYTLQRRHIVDPTRAPGYKRDPNAPAPETTETWRDAGYYSLNPAGLVAAVEAVILRTVHGSTAAETLPELLAEYNREAARLREVITDTLRLSSSP